MTSRVDQSCQSMIRVSPRRFCIIFLLVASGIPLQRPVSAVELSGESWVISVSPDGSFLVKKSAAAPGERGEAMQRSELCDAKGKVLYAWISPIGSSTALWSPDHRYLAVNEMPGIAGDQLRILSLEGDKQGTRLREPDGRLLKATVEKLHGGFLRGVSRVSLHAWQWEGGRLWCRLGGEFSLIRQPQIRIPFHFLWVLRMEAGGAAGPVLDQEWEMTLPKERPSRLE